MIRFFIGRLAQAIPVIFIVITATFFMVRAAPGGPFDAEKTLPPEVIERLNERYNLDAALHEQYFDYLKHIAQGDFGPSFRYTNRTVTEMIAAGLPITFELAIYAMIVALVIGISAGMIAAIKPNSPQDYIPMSLAMTGICMPSFLLGPILVLIFGIGFQWLPVSGWGYSPGDKILPSITLGSTYAAYIARLTRGGMLEVLAQDYIRTAKAKGLATRSIIFRHALRGGLSPVVAFLGPAIAGLLAGSFVVETIFQIPGLGRFYVQAAFNRDYTMILGTTILLSCLIVLLNMLSDMLAVWLNPRLATSQQEQ